MTVRRVMGIETEYGISVPGDPTANPMWTSGHVVNAYIQASARAAGKPEDLRTARTHWDYLDEAPLRDARGFELGRMQAHPDQLTDDPTTANTVLTNGGRLYVDHAHPEYSTPEVLTPREAICWDRAGERVMESAAAELERHGRTVRLYKNNTDGKGASYGTHENFLVRREVPFEQIVRGLTPLFVVRQVLCGTGRVGLGTESQRPGFQISQRADFFEAEVGLETTMRRPIINTRDEPHADREQWRRLHVIVPDATHADVSTLLSLGTTSLLLHLLETGRLDLGLGVVEPVAAMHQVSHDPELTATLTLEDGRTITALDLLEHYLGVCTAAVQQDGGPDAETAEVLGHWERVLHGLRTDHASIAPDVEWVAKRRLLEGYRARHGATWDDARVQTMDIQWSDVRRDKGLANAMRARGKLRQLVADDDIQAAVTQPPASTRAWLRGRLVDVLGPAVKTASWDTAVLFNSAGDEVRIGMLDPYGGAKQHAQALLAPVGDGTAELTADVVIERIRTKARARSDQQGEDYADHSPVEGG